jgi:hypothetical protein
MHMSTCPIHHLSSISKFDVVEANTAPETRRLHAYTEISSNRVHSQLLILRVLNVTDDDMSILGTRERFTTCDASGSGIGTGMGDLAAC